MFAVIKHTYQKTLLLCIVTLSALGKLVKVKLTQNIIVLQKNPNLATALEFNMMHVTKLAQQQQLLNVKCVLDLAVPTLMVNTLYTTICTYVQLP